MKKAMGLVISIVSALSLPLSAQSDTITANMRILQTLPESSYEISGYLMGQQPLMKEVQPFVISNIESEKPSVFSTAFQKLLSNLKSPDVETRHAAVTTLAEQQDQRAVLPLIEVLKDEDLEIRINVVSALGHLRDQRAVLPLIAALKDKNVDVKKSAARALGNLGDKRAIEPLSELRNDSDSDIRILAVAALEKLRQ